MIRPRSPDGRRLLEAVAALRQPYRAERSVKLVPGGLLADRFLVSLPKAAFGDEPLARLRDLAAGLGLPATFAAALAGPLADADAIHLGHEASGEGGVHKLYFEFAQAARQASGGLASNGTSSLRHAEESRGAARLEARTDRRASFETPAPQAPQHDEWGGRTESLPDLEVGPGTLVHLAFKWDPHRPGRHGTAEYRLVPGETGVALRSGLAALCADTRALAAGEAALDGALTRAAAGDLMLLAVREPENGRLSYDLNLYEAGLTVGSLAAPLAAAAAAFGVETAAADHFATVGRERLGHVAGGLGRDGRPFLTVYHGGMPP